MNKNLGVIQNIFICDTILGTVREARFHFGALHNLVIDEKSMGPISVFRTIDFEKGKAKTTPVYYINNCTE